MEEQCFHFKKFFRVAINIVVVKLAVMKMYRYCTLQLSLFPDRINPYTPEVALVDMFNGLTLDSEICLYK